MGAFAIGRARGISGARGGGDQPRNRCNRARGMDGSRALLISPQKSRHGPRAMTNQPFFTRDADAFIPTPAANGPWDPKSLHGRVIVGLLAFVIEQRHGSDDFV